MKTGLNSEGAHGVDTVGRNLLGLSIGSCVNDILAYAVSAGADLPQKFSLIREKHTGALADFKRFF